MIGKCGTLVPACFREIEAAMGWRAASLQSSCLVGLSVASLFESVCVCVCVCVFAVRFQFIVVLLMR